MSSAPAHKVYSILDFEHSHRVDSLTWSQVESMIRMIPPARMKHYMIKDGPRANWVPILESSEAMEVFEKSNPRYTAPSEVTKTLGVVDETQQDYRKHQAYGRSFLITVIHGRQVFKTQTKNISMKGAELEDPLPGWAAKGFRAFLFKDEQNLERVEVICVPGNNPHSIVFEKCAAEDLLRQWILR